MNNPGHLKWIASGAMVGFGVSLIFGDPIYPYFRSDVGLCKSHRLADSSRNDAHYGYYLLSKNRAFFATPPGMMKKGNREGSHPDEMEGNRLHED
jgi:hypothetical protein